MSIILSFLFFPVFLSLGVAILWGHEQGWSGGEMGWVFLSIGGLMLWRVLTYIIGAIIK